PGPAEVVAEVPDEDPVAGAGGDGLHVAGRADAGERDPGDGLPARAVDGVQVEAVVAVVVQPVDAGVLPGGGETAGLGDPRVLQREPAVAVAPRPRALPRGCGGGRGERAHEKGGGEQGEGSAHAPSLPSGTAVQRRSGSPGRVAGLTPRGRGRSTMMSGCSGSCPSATR